MINKGDYLIEYVTYNWRKFVVCDRKYKGNDYVYWENSIYSDGKLIFRNIEKSDRKKDFLILRQELMNFII